VVARRLHLHRHLRLFRRRSRRHPMIWRRVLQRYRVAAAAAAERRQTAAARQHCHRHLRRHHQLTTT
jgi:hypothetical protein